MRWNRINIMLPTYGRSTTRLPQFIDSALATCANTKNICFTFVCNKNDSLSRLYIQTRLSGFADYDIIIEDLPHPHLAKYFNMAYTQTKFRSQDICVSMFGDDFIFKSDRWDEIFLDWINAYNGIGIFYADDCSRFHGELATMFVTTRTYIDAMQPHPFMCEAFPIDEIDVIHHEIAKAFHCLFYLSHVKIYHNHATLEGNMDAVWQRMRTQLPITKKNRRLSAAYIAEAVASLNKAFGHVFNPPIRVIMTTYDRIELLRRTVASYNHSVHLPPKIDVYDDGSIDTVKECVAGMSGAVWHPCVKHLGAAARTPEAIKEQFADPSVDAVLVLDSDTQFYPTWYLRACALFQQIKDRQDIPVISLYNEQNWIVCKDNSLPGVVRKLGIGAFGMLVTRRFWDSYVSSYPSWGKSKTWDWWDIETSRKALQDGNLVGAVSPSVLQHTGIYSGTHGSAVNTACAEDFLGDQDIVNELQTAVDKSGDQQRILVSLQGRYGDCILGSLVVNMLCEQGFFVDWLTIPNYQDLVYLTAPNARIILNSTMPDSYFQHTDTASMRAQYPGYGFYINLQPGAPENHSRLLASGENMAFFVKRLAERVLNRNLPDDLRAYRQLRYNKTPDMRWYDSTKPIAIIAPDVISIPTAMTPEWIDKKYEELSQDYCVRILVKRPPDVPIAVRRQRYIYGYSFEECIFLLMQTALLIVNDSGLAWAAIYSDNCKKQVYHHRARLAETNMRYSDFDKTYTDITVD